MPFDRWHTFLILDSGVIMVYRLALLLFVVSMTGAWGAEAWSQPAGPEEPASSYQTVSAPATGDDNAQKSKPLSFVQKQKRDAAIVFLLFVLVFLIAYFFIRKSPASVQKAKADRKRKKRLKP
jgi:hypothetical protein